MKLGLSSLLFVGTSIEKAVSLSAELGAECFELIYDLPHFSPEHKKDELAIIKGLLQHYGLGISVHATFWDLNPASHYSELWELSLKHVRRSIEACVELGSEIVCLHPGRCPIPEIGWLMRDSKNRYVKFLEECTKLAKELDVRLALENINLPFCPYSTLEELGELMGEPNVGVAFDIGHAYRGEKKAGFKKPEWKIASEIKSLGKNIVHVHLHDNHGEEDEHLPPGEGDIDFEPILDALKAINYHGLLIAELWDPKNPIKTGRRGMEGFKKLLKKIS